MAQPTPCIHGKTIACVECFKSKGWQPKVEAVAIPERKCLCTAYGALLATQPDCPQHGIFERYDPAFAQRRSRGIKYYGEKFGY